MSAWLSSVAQNLVASLLWAGPTVLRLLWHHRRLAGELAAVRRELVELRRDSWVPTTPGGSSSAPRL